MYKVFCGSIGRQSAGVEAASTSADVKAFFVAGCPVPSARGADIQVAAHRNAPATQAACLNPKLTIFIKSSADGLDRLDKLRAGFLRVTIQHARIVEIK
jgi:hypothetical protein